MYYCLVASLSKYTLDSDSRRIDFGALRAEIVEQLSDEDRQSVELLYAYYDVENIINALSGHDLPHNALGNLSAEQIKAEIEAQSDEDEPFVSFLPVSVRYALDLIGGRVEIAEGQEVDTTDVERLLLENFYAQCARSKCGYLRCYVDIDRQIRNIIAGDGAAIGMVGEDVGEQSWYAPLMEVLETEDFVEREHKMDALRWNIAESLTEAGQQSSDGHYFDIAVVLCYIIQANILNRWASLSKERGGERFQKMVDAFTSLAKIEKEK